MIKRKKKSSYTSAWLDKNYKEIHGKRRKGLFSGATEAHCSFCYENIVLILQKKASVPGLNKLFTVNTQRLIPDTSLSVLYTVNQQILSCFWVLLESSSTFMLNIVGWGRNRLHFDQLATVKIELDNMDSWQGQGLLSERSPLHWYDPPPPLALLSEEFFSGVYRSCQPCSPTCTNRSVHAHCVITVRAASALEIGCSQVLLHALFVHLDSSSSDGFHNNESLIDRVCQVPDINYRVNRNIIFNSCYFPAAVVTSIKLHLSVLFI